MPQYTERSVDTKQAILELKANPDLVFSIEPGLFERVVAELLAGFGWRVSVTQATRDGGYDILGISTDNSGLQSSWLVECKRYAEGRKIGVELVRSLVGTREHIRI